MSRLSKGELKVSGTFLEAGIRASPCWIQVYPCLSAAEKQYVASGCSHLVREFPVIRANRRKSVPNRGLRTSIRGRQRPLHHGNFT